MRKLNAIVAPLFIALLTLLAGSAAYAEDAETDELEVRWSGTFQTAIEDVESPKAADATDGFPDRYDFEPVGLSEFKLDLFRARQTPLLQFRFHSPASNLDFLGGDIEKPFRNQRADLHARPNGLQIDLGYRQMRTNDLRLFPGASGLPAAPVAGTPPTCSSCGIGSWFNDDTAAGDRFYTKRTGFDGQVRLRVDELPLGPPNPLTADLREIVLRGGFEGWAGQRQARLVLGGSDRKGGGANDFIRWRGLTQTIDQSVGDVGAGLVFTPGGLFTLTLDADHQRFRNDASTLDQSVFQVNNNQIDSDGSKAFRTTNFTPDTDRITGTARVHSRIGDRAVVHGGFQISKLEQVGSRTPLQNLATPRLRDNEILYYSANLASSVRISRALSASAYFKFNLRDNKLDRTTSLFNPTGAKKQLDEFLDRFSRITAGAEASYRPRSGQLYALGYRGEWIDRDLDFAQSGTADHILPANAVLKDESQRHTVYLRTRLRPLAGLQVSGEAGYENAPETGYIRELEDVAYFKVRSSYSLPISRPATVSVFGRGEFGANDEFRQVSETTGLNPDRKFSRDNYAIGLNLVGSPCDSVVLFTSALYHVDAQDFDLVRSNNRKFLEPGTKDVNFQRDAPLDYRALLVNLHVGGSVTLGDNTDASVSYSYTRTDSNFRSHNPTAGTLQKPSKIRSDLHSIDFAIGHWLNPGLRIATGYRFDRFRDLTATPTSAGSVVTPFSASADRHMVTVGVTLTSELLAGN